MGGTFVLGLFSKADHARHGDESDAEKSVAMRVRLLSPFIGGVNCPRGMVHDRVEWAQYM